MINIEVKFGPESLPVYKTEGSAGADIYSAEDGVLAPGERRAFSTGLYFSIPEGYEVQIRPRSGLALKHGLTVLNAPGTIDSDYQGEVKIILVNLGDRNYEVKKGDRIAQMVVNEVHQAQFELVEDFSVYTERGAGGFGSTGA